MPCILLHFTCCSTFSTSLGTTRLNIRNCSKYHLGNKYLPDPVLGAQSIKTKHGTSCLKKKFFLKFSTLVQSIFEIKNSPYFFFDTLKLILDLRETRVLTRFSREEFSTSHEGHSALSPTPCSRSSLNCWGRRGGAPLLEVPEPTPVSAGR